MNVGDPIVTLHSVFGARATQIERIGRKYFYVRGCRTSFDRSTWIGGDGMGLRAITPEAFAAQKRATVARLELRAFGVEVSGDVGDELLLRVHAALAGVIAEEESRPAGAEEKSKGGTNMGAAGERPDPTEAGSARSSRVGSPGEETAHEGDDGVAGMGRDKGLGMPRLGGHVVVSRSLAGGAR